MQKLNRFFYVLCEIACVLLAVMMAFFIATNNSPLFLEIGGDNAIFLTADRANLGLQRQALFLANLYQLARFFHAFTQTVGDIVRLDQDHVRLVALSGGEKLVRGRTICKIVGF